MSLFATAALSAFLVSLYGVRLHQLMKHSMTLAICILLTAVSCAAEKPAEKKEKSVLTDNEKEYLVNLARLTLYSCLSKQELPDPTKEVLTDNLERKLGCFVTLDKKDSGLRGCIGIFERTDPLYKNVISRAVAAALHDSRFPNVTYKELADIRLEVSVLTEPKLLAFDSPEDLLKKLMPKKHGVLLYTRFGVSTFLPQVWDQIPEKEEFLAHLCAKHGAPPDTWRKDFKNVKIETYEAIVFGEEIFGRIVVGPGGGKVGPSGVEVIGWVDKPGTKPKVDDRKPAVGTALEAGTILAPGSDLADK